MLSTGGGACACGTQFGVFWNGTEAELADGMESVLTEVCRLVPISGDHTLGGSVETVLMGELYGEQLSGDSEPLLLKFRRVGSITPESADKDKEETTDPVTDGGL